MSHLKSPEMSNCLDAMYQCLFGDDMHQRWKHLKRKTKLDSEREFVGWILGFAERYADIDIDSDEDDDDVDDCSGVINIDMSCGGRSLPVNDANGHTVQIDGDDDDDDDDDDVTTRLAHSLAGVKQEVVEETVAGNLEYGCDVIFDAPPPPPSAVSGDVDTGAAAVVEATPAASVEAMTSLTDAVVEAGGGGGTGGQNNEPEYELLKHGGLTITAEADGSHTYRYTSGPGAASFIPVSGVDASVASRGTLIPFDHISPPTVTNATSTTDALETITADTTPQIIRIQMTQAAGGGQGEGEQPVTMIIPVTAKVNDTALPLPLPPPQQTDHVDTPVGEKKVFKGFIYPCNLCSAKFRDRYSLKGHVGIVHSQGKLHRCKFCVMVFHSRTDRIKHEAVKHTLHRHACDICGKTFSQSRNILPHKRAVHYVEKYPCEQCDVSYARQSHLREHMKRVHDGLRFKCNICEQTFATKQNVRRHMFVKHDIGGDETEFV